MTKWIFLGDESRRIFVSWILKIDVAEIAEDKSLILQRGETLLEKNLSEGGDLIFSTYRLPPGIVIFVPAYADNMSIETSTFDNCAIFEMFPFGKESTEDLARLLEMSKNAPAILFVMMDIVDNEEDSPVGLNSMKNIFTKKRRDVLIARSEVDILEVLHWHRPLAADIIKLIRAEIQDIYDKSGEFATEYEKFLAEQKKSGCLTDNTKNKIVSFASVKGKNHLWTSYRDAAQKILFPKNNLGGLKSLVNLYRRILYQDKEQKNSIATLIWNVQADCAELEKKLSAQFIEQTKMPKKFQLFLDADEIYSERSYLMLIKKGSRFGEIDKVFLSAYENFITRFVRDFLLAEIESHISKMQSMT